MKIIKIASGVPAGFVKIEIRINNKGGFKRQLIREGQSTCGSGDDQKYLEDLLNTAVPGFFGGFGNVTDAGKTTEFYEQNKPKVTPPVANKPEEEEYAAPQQPTRRLDQGYGV